MRKHGLAVLALFGWYLIMPPASTSQSAFAYKEPLNEWRIIRGFDVADDCEEFKGTFFEHSRQDQGLGVLNPANQDYMFAQCVATDDPRLKGGED